MKDIIARLSKGVGLVALYLVIETIVVVGVFIFYMVNDPTFYDSLSDAMYTYGTYSVQSMTVMGKILVPTLIISDIACALPILIHSRKDEVRPIRKVQISTVASIVILGLGVNILIEFLLGFVPSDLIDNYNDMMKILDGMNFPEQILMTGILAPVIEELVFRYGLIGLFKNYHPKRLKCSGVTIGIIFSAVSFGIAHGNLVQGSYAFVLGLLLGYLYTRNNNLTESILLHITVNTSSLVLSVLKTPFSQIMTGIMVVCLIVSVLYVIKIVREKRKV